MGSSNSSSNGFSMTAEGSALDIYKFENEEEEKDLISEIHKIRIPLFKLKALQLISNAAYILGNAPYHEGLLIKTKNNKFYVTQVYPISFIQVGTYNDGLCEIARFCTTNPSTAKTEIDSVYEPAGNLQIIEIQKFIKTIPNKYNIFKENCQKFCKEILGNFPFIKKKFEKKVIF